MSSFYDDASLMLLASGGAGKDGKVYSVKPVPVYGAEQITNGDFATDSDWSKETGWTISGGTADCDGTQTGNSNLYQPITFVVGRVYKVSFEVSNYSGGTIKIVFGDTGGTLRSANGIHSEKFTFASGSNFYIQANSSFVGSIDNVSVQEVLVDDGDFTFSRGSNLSATRVDADGLIEKGRENLILQSNQFDTTWFNSNTTETGGQADKDGGSSAWLIEKSAANGYIGQAVSQSGVLTASVYVKAGTTDWVELTTDNGGSSYFDLTNGLVGNNSALIDAQIESVGSGWYRCITSQLGGVTRFRIYPAEANTKSATSGSIYIQDAQLELGLAATEYIETGATTAQAGILENTPRFDYSGGATCPSLLLEPSRTNAITNSEYFNGWNTIIQMTINANSGTSPEGLGNATKLVPTTFNGEHFIDRSGFSRIAGEYLSHTVYAKADGYNFLYISNAASRLYGVYNLSNGSVEYVNSNGTDFTNHSADIKDVGNGWYRCTLIGQALVSVATYMRISCAPVKVNSQGYSFAGDGTSGVFVYGAQVEPNASYQTSYIPTYGVSQTRAQDNCIKSNINTSIINSAYPFTMYAESTYVGGNNHVLSFLKSVVSNNYYLISIGSTGEIFLDARANGTSELINSGVVVVDGQKFKVAITMESATTGKICVNGNAVVSKNNFSNQAVNSEINDLILGQLRVVADTGKRLPISEVLLFPTVLSDLDLAILTGATTYNTFAEMALALNYTVYE